MKTKLSTHILFLCFQQLSKLGGGNPLATLASLSGLANLGGVGGLGGGGLNAASEIDSHELVLEIHCA